MPEPADGPALEGGPSGQPRAYLTQVSGAGEDGAAASVTLVLEYGPKQAQLRLEVDASRMAREALLQVIRQELRALMDALECVAEEEAEISFRGEPHVDIGTA